MTCHRSTATHAHHLHARAVGVELLSSTNTQPSSAGKSGVDNVRVLTMPSQGDGRDIFYLPKCKEEVEIKALGALF